MTRFEPERQTVRLRNAVVNSASAGRASITIDGTTINNIPVYGPLPGAGAKVLILEQGGSLLVLGNAVSLLAELSERIERLEARNGDDA